FDGLLQLPSRKGHHVADCAIKGQNTACQFAQVLATAITYLHFKTAQAVNSVRHIRRTYRVSNEYGAVSAFRAQEQFQHARMDMNSVGDDVGCQLVVLQDCAQNARVAMIERAHGIESMCCMICSG